MRLRWAHRRARAASALRSGCSSSCRRTSCSSKPVSRRSPSARTQGDRAFKMSGAVVPGSIRSDGDDVRFELTEGGDDRRGAVRRATRPTSSPTARRSSSKGTGRARRSSPTSCSSSTATSTSRRRASSGESARTSRPVSDDESSDRVRLAHGGRRRRGARHRDARRGIAPRPRRCCARVAATCSSRSLAAIVAFATMEWALFAHDFSIEYVAENVARATPGLYTFTAAWSALEGSILLWVLALTGYLVGHDVALPRPSRRSARRVGDDRRARRRPVLLRAHARPGQPVPVRSPDASRSTGAARTRCCRTTRSSRSTRRCCTSGYVGFTIPFSFAIARARSPAVSAKAGSPTCAARRSSRGASSRSASCSARGGATKCSAGAATGAGTRSRTRRCCRGSPGPRSSTR